MNKTGIMMGPIMMGNQTMIGDSLYDGRITRAYVGNRNGAYVDGADDGMNNK